MFMPAQRESARERLFAAAAADPWITAAAHTGSYASGTVDRWSDIDMALAVVGDLTVIMKRWTDQLYEGYGAIHHWDLPVGDSIYRVFLLPGWLEVDIAFSPESEFGPRGPNWRTVFGSPATGLAGTLADPDAALAHPDWVIGRSWHHILHAAAAIDRGKPWQAEWWITEVRRHVLELACLRFQVPTTHGRGSDRLPAEVTSPLQEGLVRTLTVKDLRRALNAVARALLIEIVAIDEELAQRLHPMFEEMAG